MLLPPTHNLDSQPVDDWRAETQCRLSQSLIYSTLKLKCNDDVAGAGVLALVDGATYYAFQRTKLILRHMGEFTLHDGDHLFRVLTIMERLVGAQIVASLTVPEMLLLILSAFFHDIGMAVSEGEVRSWLKLWEGDTPTKQEADLANAFDRFVKARPDKELEIQNLRAQGEHHKADLITRYLISDYTRLTHAKRARQIIHNDWSQQIVYRDVNLSRHLADLCYSHAEDGRKLLSLDHSLICAPGVFACLPFIGAILRLADILDFDGKRTPSVLFAHLGVRHPVSLKEWQKHRSISAWTISPERILFAAECDHPAIEATIRGFCDLIDQELIACGYVFANLRDNVRTTLPGHYRIGLPQAVDRSRIGPTVDIDGTPRYSYRESRFTLVQTQVMDLLMGTKLYSDPEAALRELIQNSIDACLVRAALEQAWGNAYTPSVTVQFARENDEDVLRVIDNGIGMDEYIIDNYYSKVGASFYKSSDYYDLKAREGIDVQVTARFGIGVLAYFMVAETIRVESRRVVGPHDSCSPIQLLIEGPESLFWLQKGTMDRPGTTTTMYLKKGHPWTGRTDQQCIAVVEKTVPNPPWDFDVKANSEARRHSSDAFRTPNKEWASAYRHGTIFTLDLVDQELGLTGTCVLPLLERARYPIYKKTIFSRRVKIAGYSDVKLTRRLNLDVNLIEGWATTLEIKGRKIETGTNYEQVLVSGSELSVCGVSVPMNLLPRSWEERSQQARLHFPGAMYLKLDIAKSDTIDLNSARTQIIANEKWQRLAERLGFVICRGLKNVVTNQYWVKLKKAWASVANTSAEFWVGVKLADED